MTPKFGSSKQLKPSMPAKKSGAAEDPNSSKGLIRKSAPAKGPLKKEDGDKPVFGDINEPLDDALAEVDVQLVQAPADVELHKRKSKILRKMNNLPALRTALQEAAERCSDPFFGVKLAEAFEESGMYDKALEWRLWVAGFQPDDPDTVRRLAATAVRAGDLETAESYYTRLIKLRAQEDSPLGGTFYEEMLGRGLNAQQRLALQQMGLRLLARALQNHETNAGLLEAAARLAYRTKSFTEARGAFEQAIRTNPEHRNINQWKVELLRVYAQLGLQEHWNNLSSNLIQELSNIVAEDRTNTRAWNLLSSQQTQAGLFDDAITTLKDALRADSKNNAALWDLGRLYVRRGESQNAIDYYRDIIDDPSEKKSLRRSIEKQLAELYFKLGHYEESLEIYLREADSNARMIAPVLEALENLSEAEELYLKSVEQSPKDARCHLGLAEYWVRRSNWPKAAEAAESGLQCNYATEEVHTNLAVALATAHMKQKNFDKALKTMDEICELYPDSIHCTFRKVKLMILQNHRKEALQLAEEIRASAEHQTGCAPASSVLWSLLGDTCSLLSLSDEADNAYTQAIKYDAMNATAVRGLGILAEKKNNLRKANECYKRFVLLDPLNLATPVIKERIVELEKKIAALPPEEPAESLPEPAPAAAEFIEPTMSDRRRRGFPGLPVVEASSESQAAVSTTPEVSGNSGWLGDGSTPDWYNTEE